MSNINLTLTQKIIKAEIKPSTTTVPIKIGMTMPSPKGEPFETFVHDQMLSSSSWLIEHDLACYPSVTVVDTANNVVIGEIRYLSDRSLLITFSSPFSGKAYIN